MRRKQWQAQFKEVEFYNGLKVNKCENCNRQPQLNRSKTRFYCLEPCLLHYRGTFDFKEWQIISKVKLEKPPTKNEVYQILYVKNNAYAPIGAQSNKEIKS